MTLHADDIDPSYLRDEELAAECHVLGCAMLEPSHVRELLEAVVGGAHAADWFGVPFHRAAYLAITPMEFDPVSVWNKVSDHEDADDFGLNQLIDLLLAAKCEHITRSLQVMRYGAMRRRYEAAERAQHRARGKSA